MLKAPLLHMEFVNAIETDVLRLPQRKMSNHVPNKQANKQINNDLLIGFSIFFRERMEKWTRNLSLCLNRSLQLIQTFQLCGTSGERFSSIREMRSKHC